MRCELLSGESTAVSLLVADASIMVSGGSDSNLQATEAFLAAAAGIGMPAEKIICTGDIVAYCADARPTVAQIRETSVPVVMGNCEQSLGWRLQGCGCGFAEGSACDRAAAAWYRCADSRLDADDRAWMRDVPRRIDVLAGERRFAGTHGRIGRINAFLFYSTPQDEMRRLIVLAGCKEVVGGHCGLSFTGAVDDRLWHKAGAIGMAANDGTRCIWFSLIEPLGGALRVRRLPLDDDFAAAGGKMRAAGLPEGCEAALETGLRPSGAVLPAAERAQSDWPIPAAETLRRCLAAPPTNGQSTGSATTAGPIRAKFSDPDVTARGERRASVPLSRLETLWFNTGTLCNLTCHNCYIESSPRNDRLVYLSRAEVRSFLDEAAGQKPPPGEIGFTGGEPFMNPEFLGMIEDGLAAGFRVLVLTNAMKPMQRLKAPLLNLGRQYGGRLTLRVSLDHYTAAGHEALRGSASWQPSIDGLTWLSANGFDVSVAGRTIWGETDADLRAGFGSLFAALGIRVDADDPTRLVLFPEMEGDADVPEITERCWGILHKRPEEVMCATSRMVVKRKGTARPVVVSCTLLPYVEDFEMGATLAAAARPIKLNHRHCARFCVLGGSSCSPHKEVP